MPRAEGRHTTVANLLYSHSDLWRLGTWHTSEGMVESCLRTLSGRLG